MKKAQESRGSWEHFTAVYLIEVNDTHGSISDGNSPEACMHVRQAGGGDATHATVVAAFSQVYFSSQKNINTIIGYSKMDIVFPM